MAIDAKVATFLNQAELAVNAGSQHGVEQDDEIRIVRRTPIEDPVTHADLGSITTTVVTLQVRLIADKFAVGRVVGKRRLTNDIDQSASPLFVYVTAGMDVVIDHPERQDPPADDMDELPF
jgi:hypothetical protein